MCFPSLAAVLNQLSVCCALRVENPGLPPHALTTTNAGMASTLAVLLSFDLSSTAVVGEVERAALTTTGTSLLLSPLRSSCSGQIRAECPRLAAGPTPPMVTCG